MRGGRELLCSKLTKYLENSRQILAKMIHHAVVVVIVLLIMTAPRHNEAAQQLDNGIINDSGSAAQEYWNERLTIETLYNTFSMTRLGDLLDFGQAFIAFGSI